MNFDLKTLAAAAGELQKVLSEAAEPKASAVENTDAVLVVIGANGLDAGTRSKITSALKQALTELDQ